MSITTVGPGVCLCGNNFQIKLYSTFSYIFMFFNLIILTISNTVIEILFRLPVTRILVSIFFYFVCFTFTFAYLLLANEVDLETYPIILGFLCFVPIFQIKHLRDLNYDLKIWIGRMIKMNSINYLIFGNYVLCRSVLPSFGEYMRDTFGAYLGKNLCSFSNFIYFSVFTIMFQKCIYIYYDFLKILNITDQKAIDYSVKTLLNICSWSSCCFSHKYGF